MKRLPSVAAFKGFNVHVLPVLKDNFSYVIHCSKSGVAGVVDVAEVAPIEAALKTLGIADFSVLSTHKHWDHSGGNEKIAAAYKGLKIYGGEHDNIPACTNPVADKAKFNIGELTVDVLHTPCHTSGHVLYHVYHPDAFESGALFTGDTLFVGGIGAFFEGNAQQMVTALNRCGQLPPDTAVFCGHEYTVNFLKFAVELEPDNTFAKDQLSQFEEKVKQGIPTVPSTIGAELLMNPFMRTGDVDFQKKIGVEESVKLMQHLYDNCP